MVATIDIFKGSLLETSYYNVYFNIILAGTIIERTSDHVTLGIVANPDVGFEPTEEQAAMRIEMYGTGLAYDGDGDVIAGTTTRVEFYNELGFIAQLTGYPMDAAELFEAFEAAKSFDLDPIFEILYDRVPYVVNGSEEGDYFGAASLGDTFFGNGGPDELNGALGNDTVNGGPGNDKLSGGEDDDIVNGDAGDDLFLYETGADTLNGGPGTDFLSFLDAPAGAGPFTVDLAAGTMTREGSAVSLAAIEGIIGDTSGNGDTFIGDDADNIFLPGGFNVSIDGGAGHDRLVFHRFDALYGGATRDSPIDIDAAAGSAGTSSAPDTIHFVNIESFAGSHSNDDIIGSDRDEEFLPMQGADSVDGGGGNDTLSFELEQIVPDSGTTKQGAQVDLAANTAVDTGGQTDTIANIENVTGSTLDDSLTGDGGANVLRGLAGFDSLIGAGGDDTLDGGANPGDQGDIMLGGTGNDVYHVDSGLDLVDEGIVFGGAADGVDEIISHTDFFWDFYSAGDIIRVAADAVDPEGDGTTIVGSVFSNFVVGNSATNVLFGRGGADTYIAGDGIDFISLSTLGLTDENAYEGVDGVNTVIVEQRTSGPTSYDIVFEFESGKDKVDLSDYGFASAAAAFATGVNDGAGNSYFVLGDGLDYLYMVGLELAELSASDFVV